jgi:hypothetical protein
VLTAAACTDLAGLDDLRFGAGAGGMPAVTSASTGGAGSPSTGGASTQGAGGAGQGGSGGGGALSDYAAEVMADAPRAYWRLGDPSGTVAADASGNGHHGSYLGRPKQGVPGAIAGDTAVSFDGIDDVVSVTGSVFAIEGTAPFSVELWLKREDEGSGILGRNVWTGGPDELDGFMVALSGNGSLRVQRENAQLYPTAPPIGTFFHLVVTYDGAELRVFIDGMQAQSGSSTAAVTGLGLSVPLLIGNVSDWSHFRGTLDEVALYDKALPAARIQAHHAAAQ